MLNVVIGISYISTDCNFQTLHEIYQKLLLQLYTIMYFEEIIVNYDNQKIRVNYQCRRALHGRIERWRRQQIVK